MPDRDSMLYWLAEAAKQARTSLKRKQVHVAASLNSDQSTVARFEKATSWPRDADQMVSAYAEDLDIDELDLWEQAVRMWRADRQAVADLDAATRELEQTGRPARTRHGRS